MKVSIIYGSVRSNRNGIRAVKLLDQLCRERDWQVAIIDPMEYQLPLLDKMYKEYDQGDAPPAMEQISEHLNTSDGFIVVSGEYNHSIPPALKNVLDHFQKEYYFKPSGIAAYSAGQFGGMRAAVHLRAILAELGTPAIPTIVSYPKIQHVLDEHGNVQEAYYTKSSNRFLDELYWYMEAFKTQRAKGTPT